MNSDVLAAAIDTPGQCTAKFLNHQILNGTFADEIKCKIMEFPGTPKL